MNNSWEKLVTDARADGPQSVRAAGRLMTLMTDQPQHLPELLAASHDWPQPQLVLGITGAPGSGKSTLVDHLAIEYRLRFPDRKLGILAVDPTSPFTGGAILGDRVRMMRHSTDPKIFVRSLASRGHLGGLALGAKGVARVMGLIGCELVMIETVGVGQSEVEIAANADLTIVVLAPGQGDSVQMLKAGLIEAGDLFVINKADHPESQQLEQQLLAALQIGRAAQRELQDKVSEIPQVFLTSAAHHEGIRALVDELERLTKNHSETWRVNRDQQRHEEIRQAVLAEVQHRVSSLFGTNGAADRRIGAILNGNQSMDMVVEELLRQSLSTNEGSKSPAKVVN
jgi:LAO/AO transport system kinase